VVDSIINSRLNNSIREYEVVWEGYSETSWETIDKFSNCMSLFEDYCFKVSDEFFSKFILLLFNFFFNIN
jgi:hypothetical protein